MPYVASLFTGVGGIELGLARGDKSLHPCLFCEIDADARLVLEKHYPGVPIAHDVRALEKLPDQATVLVAGTPCCDFSISNTEKRGIEGSKSCLLREVFRLLDEPHQVSHLVFENVANMVWLNGGEGLRELASELIGRGYSYAYRVLDARAFGLRQRRRRLVLVAQKGDSPPMWLLGPSVEAPKEPDKNEAPDSFSSFSWVDGNRGCGFANDSVPTIRAHATLHIASQPAIIFRCGRVGILSPEDGEQLQGLPAGWTACLPGRRRFGRIGNSVPVPMFEWVGSQLLKEQVSSSPFPQGSRRGARPSAGYGGPSSAPTSVCVSPWPFLPLVLAPAPLAEKPLSTRAKAGFLNRAVKGKSGMPGWALNLLADQVAAEMEGGKRSA